MATRTRLFLASLLCLWAPAHLAHAQESPVPDETVAEEPADEGLSFSDLQALDTPNDEERSYYLTETDDGIRIIQRFKWTPSDFVLYYRFLLERLTESGTYVEVEDIETEETLIELSLPHGMYRFKVQLYNLLGVMEFETDWVDADIKQAYYPKISGVSPGTLYLEEQQDGIFTVTGSDFRDESQVFFTTMKGKDRIEAIILERSERGRRMRIQVDPAQLDATRYQLVLLNPGGFFDKSDPVTVRFRKPMDFDVSAGYILPFIAFDTTIPTYFESRIWPVSFMAKATFIPSKHNWGYLGIGAEASYTRMAHDFGSYDISGNMLLGHLNFVYQYPIRRPIKDSAATRHLFTLEGHAGVGATVFNDYVFHFPRGIQSETFNSLNLSIDVGAAFAYYVTKRLFLEVNVDFVYAFTRDMGTGIITPSVLIGWQF